MPLQPKKTTNTHLSLVKVESTYAGETAAIATADTTYTFHTRAEPTITPGYLFDGALEGEGSPGGSARPNIATTGRWAQFELPCWWRSCTATYSGTVVPDLVRALRGHGLSLSFSTGTLTLAPQRNSHTSIAVDVYLHGEQEHIYGAFLNEISVAFAAGKVPEWTLKGQGIRGQVPVDASVPSLGYQTYSRNYAKFVTTAGGNAAYLTTATGSVTVPLVVREGTWTSTREITERLSSAEAGDSGLRHPGMVLGPEVATFEGVVEATTLSTVAASPFATASFNGDFDATQLYETGALFAFGLQSGTMSAQHGFKIVGPTSCFTAAPVRQKAGAASLWEVKVRMNASTDVAADAYAITAT